jgi:hypothetical protein
MKLMNIIKKDYKLIKINNNNIYIGMICY